ncbi:MAG: DUF1565 domain-containing protein [Oscillospiraceae bacterium]|nr:DUF1565 domain-containing protein [Oscillospiraceae bacterium]
MEYHVMLTGHDMQAGTVEAPFRTISKAAAVALPGDVVTVHAGTYREWVSPQNGGTEHARITYRAAENEDVVITGAEAVSEWSDEGEGVWKTAIPNTFFGDYNPYSDVIGGDWYFERENVYHTGEVYLNGKSMYEAQTLDGVRRPVETAASCDKAGSLFTWYCEADNEKTVIWANFQGADPRSETVEINVRPFVFWPKQTGRGFITVRGFTLRQAATQWAPPTALQTGLIGPHWSRGWIIEDNIISDSKNSGISLGKDIGTGHNEWTRLGAKGGTQREREVIFRALHGGGWHKENVGGHIVRNNIIRDCEQTGIVGHLGAAFSTIEHNHIYRIHYKRQFHGAEVGGIKLHAAIDTQIKRNFIHDSYRGLWLDWQAQGTHISRNVFYDNSSEDFMAEVCHGPYLLDNNLFLSKWAFKDMSEGGAFVHNLILGKFAACTELTRYTPYHFPHHTDVYGVSNIYGGDNRFYNNVFLRHSDDDDSPGISNFWNGAAIMDGVPSGATFKQTPVGTAQYDDYPAPDDPPPEKPFFERKLPVRCAHNLYLNGAKPCAREVEPAVYKDAIIDVEIIDRAAGRISVRIKNADRLNTGLCRIVTTQTLGQSFHAEMMYEAPDGAPLCFDTDYFGNRRDTVVPGPFAVRDEDSIDVRY